MTYSLVCGYNLVSLLCSNLHVKHIAEKLNIILCNCIVIDTMFHCN